VGAGAERGGRLASLDALRGFDMVWIVGGREVVVAAAAWTGWGWLRSLAAQMRHAEWHGFTAWDLVFPLFLFLAGVSFSLSLARRRARGDSEGRIRAHVVSRGLALVALGVLYNVGPSLDLSDVRYASVLGRIGLAWMLAALIALRWGPRGQLAWFAAILLGYWAALTLVTPPGQAAPSLAPGETLADWLDRTLLPGRLHRGVRDPEGILSTVPAVATALLGMWAGRRLLGAPGRTRVLVLAGTGVVALALGWSWDGRFPINKNLWSSSFVLWSGGWSLLLLALFHGLFDVLGLRRAAALLAPVGANALGAYLLARFVDLPGLADRLLPGGWTEGPARELAAAGLGLGGLYGLLWLMYRRRWFVRI